MPGELIELVTQAVAETAVVGSTSNDKGCRKRALALFAVGVISLCAWAGCNYFNNENAKPIKSAKTEFKTTALKAVPQPK